MNSSSALGAAALPPETDTIARTGGSLKSIKAQFPGLAGGWHYLDSAATAQKPQAVIDATVRALGVDYATVHRGVYARSAEMTLAFEAARAKVAALIGGQPEKVEPKSAFKGSPRSKDLRPRVNGSRRCLVVRPTVPGNLSVTCKPPCRESSSLALRLKDGLHPSNCS